jgi:DNA (cytosine-5)-methyltransferase 1
MIRLATVFSGIGAIEHALDRMGLEHEIVFACDNGDVDILSKKIDDNINDIQEEIKSLKEIVKNNIEKEDEFSKQLKKCENKFKKVTKTIKEIQLNELNDKLLKILEKSLNKNTKSSKRKEYETMLKTIKKSEKNSENNSFEKIKVSLKILNDFSKDNNLKQIDESKIKSSDELDWIAVIEEIDFVNEISEKNNFKKIQKDVKEVCEYLGMLHERINTLKIHNELDKLDYAEKKKYVDNLYAGKKEQNKVKKSYMANYDIDEENFHWNVSFLDGKQYKDKVDLFVGGSPCQSFSLVGKQRGLEDTRGTLFYEYARLVSEIRPKVFIYENVKAVLSNDEGRTWEVMKKVFTDLDYTWKQAVLNAKNFGIPQNRERIFVVGFRNDLKLNKEFKFPNPVKLDKKLQDFLIDNVSGKYYLPKKGVDFVMDEKNLNKRYTQIDGEVSLCQKKNQQFNWHGDFVFVEENKDMEKTMQDLEKYFLSEKVKKYVLSSGTKGFYSKPEIDLEIARPLLTTMHKMHRAGVDNYVTTEGRIRKLTPRECLRLMGFCDSFKIVVSDTAMYQQAGNSIVVDVLIAIMTKILESYDFSEGEN